MCGNQTCPLAWRDKLNLRRITNDIAEECSSNLLGRRVEPGYVIFDVCQALNIEPREVLPAETVNRIEAEAMERPWPTLTEADNSEPRFGLFNREPAQPGWLDPLVDAGRLEAYTHDG